MNPRNRTVDPFRYLSPASKAIVKTMIAMAPRDPVPWTPLPRPLSEATVALVSTAGLSILPHTPFDAEGERKNPWWGDPSYRVIPRTATEADIVASHLHIETAYIQQDLDVALPLRRLAEAEGRIARVAPSHYSFMGYLLDPTEFLERSVPAMIGRMRAAGVDVALFVPVPPPTKTDTEIQTEAARARARLRKRQGRAATFLSAGPGVAGDADVAGENVVQRPTLLGGGG